MTLEHRLIVGLRDIKAVTLECKKCGGRLSLAPDNIPVECLFSCAACNHPWVSSSTTTAKKFIAEEIAFVDTLRPSRTAEDDAKVGVRILLEFDLPQ